MPAFQEELTVPKAWSSHGISTARVRHKDNTGRWSHWSPAHQFIARLPVAATPGDAHQ
ncbi:MAG: hypothetical protein R2854_01305 [Caldilineaceae bacterium]